MICRSDYGSDYKSFKGYVKRDCRRQLPQRVQHIAKADELKSDCTLPANMLQFQKANKWRDWSRIHMNKTSPAGHTGCPVSVKNYTYNLIYQVMTLLTPFITTPYLSRVLGPDGTGIQSYTNSVVQYFCHCGGSWNSLLRARGRLPCTGMIGKR